MLSLTLSSCNFESNRSHDSSIELIGAHTISLTELPSAVSIGFNGDKKQKEEFEKLMNSTEMTAFSPQKANENYYREGMYDQPSSPKAFTYSITYNLSISDPKDKDRIADVLAESDIPASINSNGYYISSEKNNEIQAKAFQMALVQAEGRIKAYADSLNLISEVIEVEEIDDYQLFPQNGLFYGTELIKKVRVKALLY
ncbi:hypothetical protein GCM10007049_11930 [Echinicola pacifica]|uniref:Uncharacterized protein n=2 Tax=Echinicola pacifica TaxID=346377 RepID=A0A918PS78_9BACT|nr:hypothetical protein GCM10007049_11930 [Echinicola pacifica]